MCIHVGVEHWKNPVFLKKDTAQGHFNLSASLHQSVLSLDLKMFDAVTFFNRAEQSGRQWKSDGAEESGQSDQKKVTDHIHPGRDEQMSQYRQASKRTL